MEKTLKVKIPSSPNFILIGDIATPIADFTDEELKQVGKEWTEDLIRKAQLRRNKDQ